MGQPAAEEPSEGVGLAREGAAAAARQAQVDVTARTSLSGCWFSHKGDTDARLIRNLFQALLEQRVVVRHLEDAGVTYVYLMLAEAPLAFRVLHRDPGGFQVTADSGGEEFLAGALQQVIVFQVPAEGLEFGVVSMRGIAVGIPVDVILQF